MIADVRHRPVIDSLIRFAGLVLEATMRCSRGHHARANALLPLPARERLATRSGGLYKLLRRCW